MGGPMSLGSTTSRRYNLTFSVNARNIFNDINYAPLVGNLSSPLFGQPNAIAGGPFGSSSAPRKIELQAMFNFLRRSEIRPVASRPRMCSVTPASACIHNSLLNRYRGIFYDASKASRLLTHVLQLRVAENNAQLINSSCQEIRTMSRCVRDSLPCRIGRRERSMLACL